MEIKGNAKSVDPIETVQSTYTCKTDTEDILLYISFGYKIAFLSNNVLTFLEALSNNQAILSNNRTSLIGLFGCYCQLKLRILT